MAKLDIYDTPYAEPTGPANKKIDLSIYDTPYDGSNGYVKQQAPQLANTSTLGEYGTMLKEGVKGIPNYVAQAVEGSTPYSDPFAKDYQAQKTAENEAYINSAGADDDVLGGLATAKEIRQAAPSMSGSLAGMAPTLAGVGAGAAIGTAFPVIGTGIGGLVGGIVGGLGGLGMMKRSAENQFVKENVDKANQERASQGLPALTQQESIDLQNNINASGDTSKIGYAEAVPETIGNAAQIALMASPLGKAGKVGATLLSPLKRAAVTAGAKALGVMGTELGEEEITRQLQNPIMESRGFPEQTMGDTAKQTAISVLPMSAFGFVGGAHQGYKAGKSQQQGTVEAAPKLQQNTELAPTINPIAEQAQAVADTAAQEHQSQQAQGNPLASSVAAANAKIAQDNADAIKAGATNTQQAANQYGAEQDAQPIGGNARNGQSSASAQPTSSSAITNNSTPPVQATTDSQGQGASEANAGGNETNVPTKPTKTSNQQQNTPPTLAANSGKSSVSESAPTINVAPQEISSNREEPINEITPQANTEPAQTQAEPTSEPATVSTGSAVNNRATSIPEPSEVQNVSPSNATVSSQTTAVKKDPILKQTKEEWISGQMAKSKSPKNSIAYKTEVSRLNDSHEDSFYSALASLTFDEYAKHPFNKGETPRNKRITYDGLQLSHGGNTVQDKPQPLATKKVFGTRVEAESYIEDNELADSHYVDAKQDGGKNRFFVKPNPVTDKKESQQKQTAKAGTRERPFVNEALATRRLPKDRSMRVEQIENNTKNQPQFIHVPNNTPTTTAQPATQGTNNDTSAVDGVSSRATQEAVSDNEASQQSEANDQSQNTTKKETTDTQAVAPSQIEARRKETEVKIKGSIFQGGGVFSLDGGSNEESVPTDHREVNGVRFVAFSNPTTRVRDVVMSGTSAHDFVGFYRIYENGKPTDKWSSKFENSSGNKENFKTMMSVVQEMLPQGHEYTESTSISTDGLRVWYQQLSKGYELQYDSNGNLITNTVAINGDSIVNDLGIEVDKGEFENISVTNSAQFESVKKALLPKLEKFGLNQNNIHWVNGTVKIDLPILKRNKNNVAPQTTQESTNGKSTNPATKETAAAQTVADDLKELSLKPKSTFIIMVIGSLSGKSDSEKAELFSELGISKGISVDNFKKAAGKYWESQKNYRLAKKDDRKNDIDAIRRQRLEIARARDLYEKFGIEPEPIDITLPSQKKAKQAEAAKETPEQKTDTNTVFTEDMANAARERLRAKLGRLNSGVDPEMFADGIVLAGYHIEKGARTFAAYAKAMVADMGDEIKPYLKQFYYGVKSDPRAGAFAGDMDKLGYVEDADIEDLLAGPKAEPAKEDKPKPITETKPPKDSNSPEFDGVKTDSNLVEKDQIKNEPEQPTKPQPLSKAIESGDIGTVLAHIEASKSSFGGIAKVLGENIPPNLKLLVVPELKAEKTKDLPLDQQRDVPSKFYHVANTIKISAKVLGESESKLAEYILHELAHAETVFALKQDKGLFRPELNNIIQLLKKHTKDTDGWLVAKNQKGEDVKIFNTKRLLNKDGNPIAEELVAYGLTNTQLQVALQEVAYNSDKSLWDKFVDAIAKSLGIPVKSADRTALAAVLKVSMELIDEQGKQSSAEPAHIEGNKSEDATQAVITKSLEKANLSNPKLSYNDVKKELIAQIDKAMESVQELQEIGAGYESPVEKITFNIKGDGKFTVINTKEALEEFKAKVEKTHEQKQARYQTANLSTKQLDAIKTIERYAKESEALKKRLNSNRTANNEKPDIQTELNDTLQMIVDIAENNDITDNATVNSIREELGVKPTEAENIINSGNKKQPYEMSKAEFDSAYPQKYPNGKPSKSGKWVNITIKSEDELSDYVNSHIAKGESFETQKGYYDGMKNFSDKYGVTWYVDHELHKDNNYGVSAFKGYREVINEAVNEGKKVHSDAKDIIIQTGKKAEFLEQSQPANTEESAQPDNGIKFSKAPQSEESIATKAQDKLYLDAVNRGDMETAQKMVDMQAVKNGYVSINDYRGSHAAPSMDYTPLDERVDDGGDFSIEDIANGYSSQPDDYFDPRVGARYYGYDDREGLESQRAIRAAFRVIQNGEKATVTIYRAVPKSSKEGKIRNGDWITLSRTYAKGHADHVLDGDYRIISQEVPAEHVWWDGNDINEWGYDDGKDYVYASTKNNRKLTDAVTYDDNGKVIPLSKRFNTKKGDERFSKSGKTTNAHTRESFTKAFTTQLDKQFGQGWTKLLMATGKVKVVSSEEADRVIKGGEKFHRVWHGTPHDFDKFDSAHMGSGEGAQVFGYGLYFTDKKEIAEWYRDTLSERKKEIGLYFLEKYPEYAKAFVPDITIKSDFNMGFLGGVIDDHKKIAPDFFNGKDLESFNNAAKDALDNVKSGKLYETELTPTQDEYLDWDKPLSEQSSLVKSILKDIQDKKLKGEKGYLTPSHYTGAELYHSIGKDKFASEYLHSLGIRGIRYKAEGGKSDANNYVIFADNDIQIITKYSKNGKVQAFYNPANDTAYFVADNIDKNKDLLGLAAHELGVHALQLGKNDTEFKAILSQVDSMIAANSSKAIRTALARAKEADTKPEHVTEEVLAYLIESHPKLTLVQKFLTWFKNKLRAIGKALPPVQRTEWFRKVTAITESDLVGMAVSALKSAPNDLLFDSAGRSGDGVMLAEQQARFYSALRRAFLTAPEKVFTNGQAIKSWINSNAGKFEVKKDELYWSGLNEWLDIQGKVSRDDVVRFLNDNGVKVEDVELGVESKKIDTSKWTIKYEEPPKETQQRLISRGFTPKLGGYRVYDENNKLIGLPYKDNENDAFNEALRIQRIIIGENKTTAKHNTSNLTLPNGTDYRELVVTIPAVEKFNEDDSTHFGDVGHGKQIAWIRHNSRTDDKMGSGLFLEEVQSQRGSQGRTDGFKKVERIKNIKPYLVYFNGEFEKSFKTEKEASDYIDDEFNANEENDFYYGENLKKSQFSTEFEDYRESESIGSVPPAPFVTDNNNSATNAYISLLMKKAISTAIDNGQNFISWTTGDQQADRYSLDKSLKKIVVLVDEDDKNVTLHPIDGESIELVVDGKGTIVDGDDFVDKNLTDVVGKDMADKILSMAESQTLTGDNLKIKAGWTQAMYGDEQGLNQQGRPSLITQSAGEIARKFGGKIGTVNLSTGTQPALIITPEMRQKVLNEGMPLFSKKDTVISDLFDLAAALPDKKDQQLLKELESLWNEGGENITKNKGAGGRDTSLMQIPAGAMQLVESGVVKPNTDHLELGAGKYDMLQLAYQEKGVTTFPIDPFNRSSRRNLIAHGAMKKAGGVSSSTNFNVLNVIENMGDAMAVIDFGYGALKSGGTFAISVYEGNRKGVWDGSQRNRPLKWYEPFVKAVAPNAAIEYKNGLMLITKPMSDGVNIKPYSHGFTPIGKDIMGSVYVHRDYIDDSVMSAQQKALAHQALALAPSDTNWNLVSVKNDGSAVTVQESPDFDTADEPALQKSITYAPENDGLTVKRVEKGGYENPKILHGKNLWVGDDYKGFDTVEAEKRYSAWKSVDLVRKNGFTIVQIGRRNDWNKLLATAPVPNLRYSFAGENALTADKYQLETAKERLANGEDKEVVRKDTGWFMGADGLPRFEIVDKKAKVKPFNTELSPDELQGVKKDKTPVTKFLGDLINHESLFSAYPQLKTMLVTMTPSLKPRRGASYNSKWNTINIETPYKTNGKLDLELSPLLHEVQHAIQAQEGFASGGNIESMDVKTGGEEYAKSYRVFSIAQAIREGRDINQTIEEVDALGWGGADVDEIYYAKDAAVDDRLFNRLKVSTSKDKFEAYQRLAGEIEARNTQARLGLTAEQRRNTPIADTQDISDSEAIVVWNGQEMRSEPANAGNGIMYSMTSSIVDTNGNNSLKDKLLSNLSEQDKKVISALDRAISIIKKNPSVIDNPEGRIRVLQYRMDKALKKASRGVNTAEVNDATLLNELVKAELALEEGRNIIAPLDVRSAVQKIQAQAASGIISTNEVARQINGLLTDLDTRKAQKIAKETLKPDLVRGTDWIKERLYRARRNGELDTGAIDLALWMLDKNPDIADDLAISIRDMKSDIAAGSYSVMNRVINLNNSFTGSGSNTVIAHEILHHTERLLPSELRNGILKEYSSRLSELINNPDNYFDTSKYTVKELADIQKAILNSSMGDKSLLVKLIGTGKFPTESLYQLSNASEFFAVNGERLINEKSKSNSLFAKIKQWYKELAEYVKSQLGYNSDHAAIKALDAIISGNNLSKLEGSLVDTYASRMLNYQNESDAIPDDFSFDNINLDSGVHYSLASGATDAIKDTFSQKAKDNAIYLLQDKYIDLKRRMQDVVKNGGVITEDQDPRMAEELYHKRLSQRVDDFLKDELNPILKGLHDAGLSMDDFQKFLHAKHAPSRNAVMAERNPNQQMIDDAIEQYTQELEDLGVPVTSDDKKEYARLEKELSRWEGARPFKGTEEDRLSLSGLSDDDAQSFINSLPAADKTKMQALANKVYAINQKTLDLQVDYGLETQQTIDNLNAAWENYVPLHRDEAHPEQNSHPVGSGFSVQGSAFKNATGSNSEVTNILSHIAMAREQALTRGEKVRVDTALISFLTSHPDPDFAVVGNIPTVDVLVNGFVETHVDPSYRNKDNYVMTRHNGKDIGIEFNPRNESAARLALALKSMDGADLDMVENIIAKGTRWFASVNTQYNLVFGIMNLMRDTQGGLINLASTPLAGKQTSVMKAIAPALKAIYGAERGHAGTGDMADLYREYSLAGGTTGFRDLFADVNARHKAIQREFDKHSDSQARVALSATFKWLSDFNTAMENSVRLAAYKVARDNGHSIDKSASIAKNLTVNFNRKGAATTKIGAFYAFFNASAQGTTRMIETLRSPAGKKIIASGVALGAASALLGITAMGGDDWDKIPENIRERNLIIPDFANKGNYFAIPMPLGFHLIPNIGRKAVEMAFGSNKVSNTQRLGELITASIDSFNPLGGKDIGQTITPTIADPIAALWRNKDWTGKSIYKEDFNSLSPTVGFKRTKDTATGASKLAAEAINKLTGGTDYKQGLWSPTPDQIDYVFGQMGGGTYRELSNASQAIASNFNNEELPMRKVPLLGKLYGETSGNAVERGAYYDNIRRLNEHEAELDGLKKEPNGMTKVSEYLAENPDAKIINKAKGFEKIVNNLSKRRKELLAKNADKDVIRSIDDRIAARMKVLNDTVMRSLQKS